MSEPIVKRVTMIYNFSDATTAQVTIRELLQVPSGSSHRIMAIRGYLHLLEVRDRKGERMIVLPGSHQTASKLAKKATSVVMPAKDRSFSEIPRLSLLTLFISFPLIVLALGAFAYSLWPPPRSQRTPPKFHLLEIDLGERPKECLEEIDVSYRKGHESRSINRLLRKAAHNTNTIGRGFLVEIERSCRSDQSRFKDLLLSCIMSLKKRFAGGLLSARGDIIRGFLDLTARHDVTIRGAKGAPPLYFSAEVPDKYEVKNWKIHTEKDQRTRPLSKELYDEIEADSKSFAVMVHPPTEAVELYFAWIIGIPRNVLYWIKFGALVALAAPVFSMVFFTIARFPFISTMLLAVVTFIAGLRLLVFYDIELLSGWSDVYILLIIFNFLVLLRLAGLAVT